MQDDNKEWLSALVDGHADLKDLDQVIDSKDNRDTWLRYHLIGDIMRDETDTPVDIQLVNSIEAALAEEATIVTLAARRPLIQRIRESAVVQKSSRFVGKSAQFAIAASVALVSVMGVQHYQQSVDEYSPLPVLQTNGPISGSLAPVSLSSGTLSEGYNSNQNTAEEERAIRLELLRQQQRINALLFDHQQQLKVNGGSVRESDH